MLLVLMFKKEIRKMIEEKNTSYKWKSVDNEAYSTDMIQYPYFVVDTDDTRYHESVRYGHYTIVKPVKLSGYVVNKNHVEPYLPDEIFEWIEDYKNESEI